MCVSYKHTDACRSLGKAVMSKPTASWNYVKSLHAFLNTLNLYSPNVVEIFWVSW